MTLFLIRWIFGPHLVAPTVAHEAGSAAGARRAHPRAHRHRRVTRDLVTRVLVLTSEFLLNVDLLLIVGICFVAVIHGVRG